MKSLVSLFKTKLPEPSPSDKTADRERLLRGISEKLNNTLPIEIGLNITQRLPFYLRENNFNINTVLGYTTDRIRVLDLIKEDKIYGVAIDIGTTNIVASLFDMIIPQRLSYMEHENPQISLGLDVLTRIHHAMSGRAGELNRLLIDGINELIRNLCGASGINQLNIYAAVIAGNTIMSHFLLNLAVENIPVEPYIPVCNNFENIKASQVGIDINPESIIYIFPNAGSYVGGDIVSGILSSGLYKEELPSILIDVGTNAEIVFGCKDWILVGAGAAGPALESGISEIGMRAIDGAIYSIDIDNNYEIKYKTIGSKLPLGVCGSGMIELISEMFKAGIIDNQGRLTNGSDKIIEIDGKKGFLLYNSSGRKLIISSNDIENFLRSKAAMFTSLYVMVKSVGLSFKDINKVYISGAFGKGINAEKAMRIGMIPNIDKNKFIPLGNSSLKGAEMLLLDKDLYKVIEQICGQITYKEMNTEGEFMKEFPGALFIPHTNPQILNA